MFNTKHIAATIAAVAVAAGATAEYIRRHKPTEASVEEAVKSFYSPEFIAFNEASREQSARILGGFYDNASDDDIRADYIVLYMNHLNKN